MLVLAATETVFHPFSIHRYRNSHLTSVDFLYPLLGRTLVLVAHPDDEAVGCGVLLQRMQQPIVVFATDGAPRSSYFWSAHGSRASYSALRWREAARALGHAGVTDFYQLADWNPIADQELFLNLECAYRSLSDLIKAELPHAILTLTYEGGHPDHDCCSFLAAIAALEFRLPVWEMPLYHRLGSVLTTQKFLDGDGFQVSGSSAELACKAEMFSAYESQTQVLSQFRENIEIVRPAKKYDFSKPPHPGTLNYEAWGWPMSGVDLCFAFASFRRDASQVAGERKWESAA
jgi:N-acetylglucosamine malate deacetylase 2